jgi:hypothetical protein
LNQAECSDIAVYGVEGLEVAGIVRIDSSKHCNVLSYHLPFGEHEMMELYEKGGSLLPRQKNGETKRDSQDDCYLKS